MSSLTFLIGISFLSHAIPPCLPREDLLGNLAAVNAPLKVNQIDEADRRSAETYATEHGTTADEIKRRFAATGDLNCGGAKSQANVTLVGNVITTTAHSLVGDNNCVDLTKNPDCIFTTEIDGKKNDYRVTKVSGSGKDCKSLNKSKSGLDWAVLKLDRIVDSKIKPYQIDPDFPLTMKPGTGVTTVGKSIDWPDSKSKDLSVHPRHYGDCLTKQPLNSAVNTNCDASPGTSGGGFLKRGTPEPVLVGVMTSNVYGGEECPPPNYAKRTGSYSICWASQATLFKGSFADAAIKAAEESGYVYNE